MHWAAIYDTSECVAALAQAGADPNQVDYAGQSPLHLAAQFAVNPQTIETLLAIGASIDDLDDSGNSPIRLAQMREKDSPILDALLGASIDDDNNPEGFAQ